MIQPKWETLGSSAEYFLYAWVPAQDQVEFLQMNEQSYRESIFLDTRIRAVGKRGIHCVLASVEHHFRPQPSTRAPVIFHTGHCGSTLLSRLLSASPNILPLREPAPLQGLAESYSLLGQQISLLSQEDWEQVARLLLAAYSRCFGDHQVALIKTSSLCNNLITPLIENELLERALLLYQPLKPHLASNLRSGDPLPELRSLAARRMHEWMKIPGVPKLFLNELDLAKLSVLSWLLSMYFMLEAKRKFPELCWLQDFSGFLEHPESCLTAIAEWMGFEDDQEILLATFPEIFARNSKQPGETFSAEQRKQKYREVFELKADQLRDAMEWGTQLTEEVPALMSCRDFLHEK